MQKVHALLCLSLVCRQVNFDLGLFLYRCVYCFCTLVRHTVCSHAATGGWLDGCQVKPVATGLIAVVLHWKTLMSLLPEREEWQREYKITTPVIKDRTRQILSYHTRAPWKMALLEEWERNRRKNFRYFDRLPNFSCSLSHQPSFHPLLLLHYVPEWEWRT